MVLNSLLQTSISEARISQANLDKEEYADIKKKLNELSDRIKDISKDFDPSSEDAVYAGYAQQTIEARTMMIDTGLKIYDDAAKSVKLIQETDNMWSNVLKADAALKESDNLVQSTSPDNYLIAKQNSETAVTELTEAKSQVAALASKTNEIDFFVYSNYVAARLESAKYSVLACDALINQNLELIGTMNLAYIEKSNVASDIALSMSTTPGQVLRTGYDLRVRPLVEEFKAARKNAADNDFALRQFLAQD